MDNHNIYSREKEFYAICDAKQDVLAGITCMTDEQAKPCDIHAMVMSFYHLHKLCDKYSDMNNHNYNHNAIMANNAPVNTSHTGLHRVAHEVMAVLDHKPVEWQNHLGTPSGLSDILQMEINNTLQAHSAMKAGTGKHSAYIHHLKNLGGIILLNLEKMTCDNK